MSSFIRARADTNNHTSVKYSPPVGAFCPQRAQSKVQAYKLCSELYSSYGIHTCRTSDYQGLIINLQSRLKLGDLDYYKLKIIKNI